MFATVCVFQDVGANAILQDIARARENIQKSLAGVSFVHTLCSSLELTAVSRGDLDSSCRRLTTPACFSNRDKPAPLF